MQSVSRADENYMLEVAEGESGYLVTRGENIFSGYIGNDSATIDAIHEGGWYVNLGDICFWRINADDGERDYYWRARDTAMLIKGGANYSFEQIETELEAYLSSVFPELNIGEDFKIAICSLNNSSEHEDDCIATVELITPVAAARREEVRNILLEEVKKEPKVSKSSVPDHVLFGRIPRNFKGTIILKDLKEFAKQALVEGFE